jgi:hypothetical protein
MKKSKKESSHVYSDWDDRWITNSENLGGKRTASEHENQANTTETHLRTTCISSARSFPSRVLQLFSFFCLHLQ